MNARSGSLNAQDAVPERLTAQPGWWRIALSRAHGRLGWERMARRALLPLLLLALWQYASTAGFFDPSFVPSPTAVLSSWW
jgi:hypothetical protein